MLLSVWTGAHRAALTAWLAVSAMTVLATWAESARTPSSFRLPVAEVTKRQTVAVQRIIKGYFASEHEFPTQVYISLLLKSGESHRFSRHFCGGTILSEKWILTAAHCVNNSLSTEVGFGNAKIEELYFYDAARHIVHENFTLYGRNLNNAANDLGLLELKNPIVLDGITTAAAKLPNSVHAEPASKTVIGWGRWSYKYHDDNPGKSLVLKKLSVDVIHCPEETPNVICVKSDAGSGICTGDSGGPLFIDDVLYGVTSYGDNTNPDPNLDPNDYCDDADTYGVYMSVLAYRDWIRTHTGI